MSKNTKFSQNNEAQHSAALALVLLIGFFAYLYVAYTFMEVYTNKQVLGSTSVSGK